MANKKYVVDTNVLLDNPEILKDYECIIPSYVLHELEKHKTQQRDKELAYHARRAIRLLKELHSSDSIHFDLNVYKVEYSDYADLNYVDDKLIQCCKDNDYGLITGDFALQLKAIAENVEVLSFENLNYKPFDYKGYIELTMNDRDFKKFNELELYGNPYQLLPNQYLIVKDEKDNVIDAFRYDAQDDAYVRVTSKGFQTKYFGKFKTLDLYQACAMDSLYHNQLTMIKGKAGSGKTLMALNFGMQRLEKGHTDRLIFFFNPVPVKGSQGIGFYKGTKDEKMLSSTLGNILVSKFGNREIVEEMVREEKIVILPFSDIRGYDTSGMDADVFIIEAQNLDKELMKIAVQRIGENCKLIIDGDFNAQIDNDLFIGDNNGMKRLSEVFRGKECYGEVELPYIYRSELAEIADEM